MKPPRWDCRNKADQDLLEEWTNFRLAELDDEQERRTEHPDAAAIQLKWTSQLMSQNQRRSLVIDAIKKKDWETFERLADTVELRRLRRPRKRGRPPSRASALLSFGREGAAEDVERIRKIWHQHYKKQNRSDPPTAIEIAARRYGMEPDELINYLKNRHRRFSRHKSSI
jgi:hypothetical protein